MPTRGDTSSKCCKPIAADRAVCIERRRSIDNQSRSVARQWLIHPYRRINDHRVSAILVRCEGVLSLLGHGDNERQRRRGPGNHFGTRSSREARLPCEFIIPATASTVSAREWPHSRLLNETITLQSPQSACWNTSPRVRRPSTVPGAGDGCPYNHAWPIVAFPQIGHAAFCQAESWVM